MVALFVDEYLTGGCAYTYLVSICNIELSLQREALVVSRT